MFFLLSGLALSYTVSMTINQFHAYAAGLINGGLESTTFATYKATDVEFYVLEAADTTLANATKIIVVTGEPTAMTVLEASINESKVSSPSTNATCVKLVSQSREATYTEQSTLFVSLIVLIIFVFGALFAVLLWYCEDNEHNPAYSLLFVATDKPKSQ